MRGHAGNSMRFRSKSLCAVVFGCLTVLQGAVAQQPSATPPLLKHTGAAGNSTTWFRHSVTGLNPSADSTNLLITGQGVVSAYLNGQQLLRRHALGTPGSATVLLNVNDLVRSGQNSICVALSPSQNETSGHFAAWLQTDGNDTAAATAGDWLNTTALPPVGWQQTDFNDRDWQKSVPVGSVDPADIADSDVSHVKWSQSGRRDAHPFVFQNGDHVVLLGATFFERAQTFGHLESLMTACAGRVPVTFRNLGWSADTVFAESRGLFDSPEKGYERMVEHVRAEEPTVIVLCYGQNEAMAQMPPDQFVTQLKRLVRDLGTTGAHVVIVSPHPFLPKPAPLPDASRWNPGLEQLTNLLQSFARENGHTFVDLFHEFAEAMDAASVMLQSDVADRGANSADPAAWTDNGIHWNHAGYVRAGTVVAARMFGETAEAPVVVVDPARRHVSVRGGKVRKVHWSTDGQTLLTLEFRETQLSPVPFTVSVMGGENQTTEDLNATVADFRNRAHRYPLTRIREGTHILLHAPVSQQYEALRALVVQKNELYFHRWRPQNITYLFGFRKHEQGNNAAEIAQFDPLIEALEAQIREVQQPTWKQIVVSVDSP